MGLEPSAAEAASLQPLRQAVERGAAQEQERFERHQGPFALEAFFEDRRRVARHQGFGVETARDGVQFLALRSQPAGDLRRRQPGELADRAQAPAVEGFRDLDRRRQPAEGQGREEVRLLALVDHVRGLGQCRGDARRELARGDAGFRRQSGAGRGAFEGRGEFGFGIFDPGSR